MFLHLSFTNGSNPFVMYGKDDITKDDCLKELESWKDEYNVVSISEDHGGIFAILEERTGNGENIESFTGLQNISKKS